jgi:hypothetical protein
MGCNPALPNPVNLSSGFVLDMPRILAVRSSHKGDDWLAVKICGTSNHNAGRYEARLEFLEVDENSGIPDSMQDYAAA